MKTLMITIAFLFCGVVSAGEPNVELHEKCIYPTVMVLDTLGKSSATGVVVKTEEYCGEFLNFVLTCDHCVADIDKDEVIEYVDGKPTSAVSCAKETEWKIRVGKYENWSELAGFDDYKAKVLYSNDLYDIALVSFVSKEPVMVAEIDYNPEVYIGEELLKVGCGLSELFRVDVGILTSLPQSIGRVKANSGVSYQYRTSLPSVQGDSGGPVYSNYKLIGLLQAVRISEGQSVYHMSYAIPIETFLEDAEISKILKLNR